MWAGYFHYVLEHMPALQNIWLAPVHVHRVAQSDAVPLRVNPGTNENGRKVVYAGGGDDFQVLNRDIRFIHTPPAVLAVARAPFYTRSWFFAAQALPVVLLAGSLLVERRRRRYREDIGFARRSRALRDAERRLAEADLYEAPLTNFGRNAVERFFTPEEIKDIVALTEYLAA